MTRASLAWTYAAVLLVPLLSACSVVRVPLPWNGDATAFAREMQAKRIAFETAAELGVEVHTGGGGGGGGGGEAMWRFNVGFDGTELERAAFMTRFAARIDEALNSQSIEVTGRGAWSGIPGFRRSYHTSSQRGFLSVYSAVTADGTVFIYGEGEEFPN